MIYPWVISLILEHGPLKIFIVVLPLTLPFSIAMMLKYERVQSQAALAGYFLGVLGVVGQQALGLSVA